MNDEKPNDAIKIASDLHAKINKELYKCPECGLHYEDKVIAKKCEAFCKKYNGCSLEITALSEEAKAQK